MRLTCMLLATLISSSALAEEPLEIADTRTYSFDDDIVGGSGRSSFLELLQVRPHKARESLLRVRENFIPELYKSVEDL